jgi:ketosteroid isomerase-like protein
LLVGSPSHDAGVANAGAAYVFVRQAAGVWTLEQKLLATDREANDAFGFSVSLDGDRALVSANLDDDRGSGAGAAYVFERQANGTWLQVAKLYQPPPNAGPNDNFGSSLSLSGDLALIGASGENRAPGTTGGLLSAGAAYLFRREANGTWSPGVLVDSTAAHLISSRRFGSAVALAPPYALIGAFTDYFNVSPQSLNCGAAYVVDIRSVLP